MEGQKRLLRRLSLRGIESDKPNVCMSRTKAQFFYAVQEKTLGAASNCGEERSKAAPFANTAKSPVPGNLSLITNAVRRVA
jgi:hypothetical protein